jgi:hypothetical protein
MMSSTLHLSSRLNWRSQIDQKDLGQVMQENDQCRKQHLIKKEKTHHISGIESQQMFPDGSLFLQIETKEMEYSSEEMETKHSDGQYLMI